MGAVIDIETFLDSDRLPIVDVRSPGEFARGHIPKAHNVPLLSDLERAEVGTIYKQIGVEQAISRGRELVLAKADQLVDTVKEIASGEDLFVHCWRGGMRSEGFAGLLEENGFQPRLLTGGYKAYRQAAHRSFADGRRVIILSGHTGAGKTQLLDALRDAGQQVIDLERLACHRGSAFGGISQPQQPTVEQFENNLFLQWRELEPDSPVWIEGESRSIGRAVIPPSVWDQMAAAPSLFVEVDREKRIDFLIGQYGGLPTEELELAVRKIRKRLGGLRLQAALDALKKDDVRTFAGIALEYYDHAYTNSLNKSGREVVVNLTLPSPGHAGAVEELCRLGYELTGSRA